MTVEVLQSFLIILGMHHHLRLLFISIILLVLLYLVYQLFAPFLLMITLGFVISILVEPLYNALKKKTSNTSLSGVMTVTLVVLFIIIPFLGFLSILFQEANQLIASFSTSGSFINRLNTALLETASTFGITVNPGDASFQQYLQNGLLFIGTSALKITSSIPKILTGIIIMLMATYYLLTNKATLSKWIDEINPLTRKESVIYYQRAQDLIIATIRGSTAIILIQGIVAGIGFTIAGVESPVLLGLLFTFASVIPIVGALLIWIPVVITLLINGALVKAIFVALWCMLFVGTIDNFLAPLLIQKRAKLHQFFILVGVLGGVASFGIFGLVLGPLVIALLFATIEIAKKIVKEEGYRSILPARTVVKE